jgi:hypothetical protein
MKATKEREGGREQAGEQASKQASMLSFQSECVIGFVFHM